MPLVSIPDNPLPPGADERDIEADDGVRLRTAWWKATSGARKGTICLLQGRAEFIEKYFETVADLTARGFAVAALDWRGQGGSGRELRNPRKGHVHSFAAYERDLDAFLHQVVQPNCPPPYCALAHSTGALVAFGTTRRKTPPFERLVLTAPLFGLGSQYGPTESLGFLVGLACLVGFARSFVPGGNDTPVNWYPFNGNAVTSDPTRYARGSAVIEADPTLAIGSPTIGWLAAALRTMHAVTADGFAERVSIPVLIVAAGMDTVVSNRAIQGIGRRLRLGRTLTVDGALHEVLMERSVYREQVLAAVDAFLSGEPER